MKKIFQENFRLIYLGFIFFISVIVGTYIYTENSGYKGCLNTYAKSYGYKNYRDYVESYEYGPSNIAISRIKNFCEYAGN